MEPEGIQLEHLLRAIVHEVLVVVVEAGVISFFNYGEGDMVTQNGIYCETVLMCYN